MRNIVKFSILAALLPLLFACNEIPDIEPEWADPAYVAYAGNLDLLPGNLDFLQDEGQAQTKAAATSLAGSIASIELTESGLYVIGRVAEAPTNFTYTSGSYSVSGNEYRLNGFGTIVFDNSKSGVVSLTIKPDNGPVEVLQASFHKPVASNKVFRAFKVEKTRVTAKGWITVSADFTGCNFREIAAFLRSNSHKVPDDVPDRSISSLSLTGTEKMILAYSDGYADLTEFSLAGNVLTYNINSMMGFTFETDRAIIEYMDGKCILTINGRIRNSTTSGSVTFVLSPLD